MENKREKAQHNLWQTAMRSIRKLTGYSLIIISIPPYIAIPFVPFFDIKLGEMAAYLTILYLISAITFYGGIALLGPEIIAKFKDFYNLIKSKIWRKE